MTPDPRDDGVGERIRDVATMRGECWVIATRWKVDDRESRLGLAEWILRRDVASWNDLRIRDWTRMVDAYRGYEAIRVMRAQAGLEPIPGLPD